MRRELRIERLQELLREMGLDGCVLKGMDNIFYLTGFRGSEGMLFVTRGDVVLIVDFRYITHAREVTSGIHIHEMRPGDDALYTLCTKYKVSKLGIRRGARLSTIHTVPGLKIFPVISLVPMNSSIEEIRRNKEAEEIALIMDAISIATQAFSDIIGIIKPGETEKDIADEFDHIMRKRGAQGPSFDTIVASGPRSALPHAEPTGRKLEKGDTVILDFGAAVFGLLQ